VEVTILAVPPPQHRGLSLLATQPVTLGPTHKRDLPQKNVHGTVKSTNMLQVKLEHWDVAGGSGNWLLIVLLRKKTMTGAGS